jgi:6-pyruvoyltetrahydropterin/6-carboxytetrahydropterin synthase
MTERLIHTAAARFEAARRIEMAPAGDRRGRLHGHGFTATVRAALPAGFGGFDGAEVGELGAALRAAVAPLNYQHLNEIAGETTDESLARWIRARLALPGLDAVGLQSTPDVGIELDGEGRARLWRRYLLQSAHRLPNVPPGHKCGRVHGHGFEVVLQADVDPAPGVARLTPDRLDALWAPLHAELDHAYLNDIPGLETPTSEILSRWLWQRLEPELAELAWVTVFETGQSGASHDGERFRIWKDMTLDSATCLPAAPAGDRRRCLHGHTYTLRLHLSAPLDAVLGWTVDFGDVKELFAPIFAELDHQPLHELSGLAQADAAALARWVRHRAERLLPALDGVDLFETRGCGVELRWGAPSPALPL